MGTSLFSRRAGSMGLTTRLSIAMAGAMLIGAAVLLVTSAVQEKAHFSQELGEYLNEEMNTLLITLAGPAATGDSATMKKMLNDGIQSMPVESITYTDSSGSRIAAIDRPVASLAPDFFIRLVDMPVFSKTEAITIGGRNFGTVLLKLTTTPATNYMWSMLVKNAQALLLVLALLLAVTTAIVRFSLRPLDDLTTGARRIGSGDYTTRISEQGAAETVLTISAFNRMAEQLRQTLDQLKQSRDRYSLLYHETPVLLHSIDRTGTLIEVNDYWLKTLGYERGEVLGRKVTDFYTEASRKYAQDVVLPAFFRDGVCENIAYQFVKKNGELVDVLLSATGERDAAGTIVRSLAVIEDVTERKKTETALQKSEQSYRNIINNIRDTFYRTDRNGTLIMASPSALSMFGYDRLEEIVGKRTAASFYQDLSERGLLIEKMKQEGFVKDYELTLVRKDGTLIPISLSSASYTDSSGEFAGFEGFIRDISERKQFEKERLKTQKIEAIGTLAGGIAHDFNNLLQGVFGYISLAKLQCDDKEKSLAALEEAEKALRRSVKLTNQLLTFSKGGKPLKKPIELLPVIESAAKFALSGSRSDYHIAAEDGLVQAEADEGQIGQVIQNIVLNADQAMPAGGRVEIVMRKVRAPGKDLPQGLKKGKDYVEIAIKDSGIGIAEECLGRIFDPYFTTKEKGSGLGLATAYSIIKNHNGLIDVASTVAKGTAFLIYLPAAAEKRKTEPVQAAGAAPSVRSANVLVMDDEQVIRDVAGELLRGLGHKAEFAAQGKEAIHKYRTAKQSGKPFDVVILDLTIRGGMGGAETINILREIDPGVKAVVSSGYSDDAVVSTYQQSGFSAFLKKPYDAEELRDVLNKVLNS